MLSLVVLCLSALAASSPIPPARRAQVGQGSLAARDSPLSDGVALIDTVNKWRGNYGLPLLAWNDQLAGNAAQTGSDNGGSAFNGFFHELLPGSMAQVMASGMQTDSGDMQGMTAFELSYVTEWLCEVPSDSQLAGICPAGSGQGETGHHDILVDAGYSNIGCAFSVDPSADPTSTYQGIWLCDLS